MDFSKYLSCTDIRTSFIPEAARKECNKKCYRKKNIEDCYLCEKCDRTKSHAAINDKEDILHLLCHYKNSLNSILLTRRAEICLRMCFLLYIPDFHFYAKPTCILITTIWYLMSKCTFISYSSKRNEENLICLFTIMYTKYNFVLSSVSEVTAVSRVDNILDWRNWGRMYCNCMICVM